MCLRARSALDLPSALPFELVQQGSEWVRKSCTTSVDESEQRTRLQPKISRAPQALKTVLVTGGAGFIGGTFVRQMLARPEWQVVNLDALTYAGCLASLASVRDDPRHTFVHGDVRDAQLVAQLLNEHQCDAIVHFAAESHVDRSIASPAEFADTNVMGTLQLLRAAFGYWERAKPSLKRDFRLVHISTDEVYGALEARGAAVS